MKWLAAAAGVVVAGGASLLLVAPGETPRAPPPPPALQAARPAPPAPRVAAASPAPASLTGVTLHGVLLRGAQSQALLSVDGQPQQAYAIGDIVKTGWSLQAIHDQQVVLANGTSSTTLGVDTARPVPVADQHPAAAAPAATGASARTPGFVAGAPAPFDMATASERNKRFLDAIRAKRDRP